jgi:hypothetical protein
LRLKCRLARDAPDRARKREHKKIPLLAAMEKE